MFFYQSIYPLSNGHASRANFQVRLKIRQDTAAYLNQVSVSSFI